MELSITIISLSGYCNHMPHMVVHHKVRDFEKWKTFFDQHENMQKISGSKSVRVFQNAEDSTDVFILFEWDSIENAKKFSASEDLKKTMEKAGVISIPHIHFLNEVK
jgi:heme-degrading monooxygenase HmoA